MDGLRDNMAPLDYIAIRTIEDVTYSAGALPMQKSDGAFDH
jgi:hypothetical protein